MKNGKMEILVGNRPIYKETKPVQGDFVHILGEKYYHIANYDQMPPFLMSLVSSADHWLFIASSGGLTAGRKNADNALFPYETEDKIATHSEQTGSKTIIRVTQDGQHHLWEPFSKRYSGIYNCDRHLYKNIYGNKLIFEEINHDLNLTLRMAWLPSNRFGFVKRCWLSNSSDRDCQVELLDGFQNLLPYGATNVLQTTMSSLLNAYKRNELEPTTGLGIFALSATLTDRAEPSESLQATVAWQVGLNANCHLLCTDQLDAFRSGRALVPEDDVRGKAGAYLVNATLQLSPNQIHHWNVVADVNQDSVDIANLEQMLCQETLAIEQGIENDVAEGTANLILFVAAADGLQLTAQETTNTHHFANVLFNIMRGGIFAHGYQVERRDLLQFIQVRNRKILVDCADWFASLPARFSIQNLYQWASDSDIPDLIRLCYEYLPLTFSRRHGDPSRPWNQFSINLKQMDGSPRLDYQGNWRDIFQNWEPLILSFPTYIAGTIAKFLNATTVDGYNPYRVTRDGIEWEVPEPDNPWANFGYWSDHQIIYLQKLLENAEQVQPGTLSSFWNCPIFAYANVPYRLREYPDMLADWNNTVEFDWESEKATESAVASLGTDGRLLRNTDGRVIHVTMTEKLLVLLLAKLTNLVPEGGIWMNTQRPEWNDANNALAGKGLSVVTVAYLRRFIVFWLSQLAEREEGPLAINRTLAGLISDVQAIFNKYQSYLDSGFTDQVRRAIMDELGMAATAYRNAVYESGIPIEQIYLNQQTLIEFLTLSQRYVEQTLRANKRSDHLTHSYNILHINEQEAALENLYLMLEGQVALLSSGILTSDESLFVLRSLRQSELYRADQHTYMLYPNRKLAGFRQKNNVTADKVANSKLVAALTSAGDGRLLIRDNTDVYHFNGHFRNANDVVRVLDDLAQEPAYTDLVAAERAFMLDLFESTFNHHAFTGRSGTFFGYEGLGSVYWHMVSKLLLAAQECFQRSLDEEAAPAVRDALATVYYDIRNGLGFNKSPAEYGAFPTDPYSHTPIGGGARQPGMTGQVKEEILTRMGELGVLVKGGTLHFLPSLLRNEEFLKSENEFSYIDVFGTQKTLSLPTNSLAFTICQTPVVYTRGEKAKIEVVFSDAQMTIISGNSLEVATTKSIFDRDGQVEMLRVIVE